MSLSDTFDVAHLVEVILDGKQSVGSILADAQEALAHAKLSITAAQRVLTAMQAIDAEIQAARKPSPPTAPPKAAKP